MRPVRLQEMLPAPLRGGWLWALLGAAAAGALAAAVVAALLPAPYRAEATLVVAGPAPTRELQLTYVDLALSPAVIERAAASTGIPGSRFEQDVRVVPAPQSLLIRIFATAERGADARSMANAIARELPAYLQQSGLDDERSLRIARTAGPAERASASLVTAAALGAVVGMAVVWVALQLRGRPEPPPPPSKTNSTHNALAPVAPGDDSESTRRNFVNSGWPDL